MQDMSAIAIGLEIPNFIPNEIGIPDVLDIDTLKGIKFEFNIECLNNT